ncbi:MULTISPECIES: hypothetical protein [unclassified Streptomyces]|uniref:hypothetical protein n=1 Tax=unclassified Streptomyces TaxID=2593676 RepID=UPI002741C223|nr:MULTISPECIES: hypothetical protein [unclassified Streptomyces]
MGKLAVRTALLMLGVTALTGLVVTESSAAPAAPAATGSHVVPASDAGPNFVRK